MAYIPQTASLSNEKTAIEPSLFVCWWTFDANYSETKIVSAKNAKEAFAAAFPFQANIVEDGFRKYAIEIESADKFIELTET